MYCGPVTTDPAVLMDWQTVRNAFFLNDKLNKKKLLRLNARSNREIYSPLGSP